MTAHRDFFCYILRKVPPWKVLHSQARFVTMKVYQWGKVGKSRVSALRSPAEGGGTDVLWPV